MPASVRTRLAAASLAIAAALLASMLVPVTASASVTGPTMPTSVSPLDSTCHFADIYVNGGNESHTLMRYTVAADGATTLHSSVALSTVYGDIAFSANGKLYGAPFAGDMTKLHRLDPSTGTVEAEVPVTFEDGSSAVFNALSVAADGDLYASFGLQIAKIDPDTGAARWIGSFPTTASGFTLHSAGDFLTLDDGTVLGIGSGPSDSYLVIFDFAAGTKTIVGTVPESFGAAQSGGRLYLATADGRLLSLDDIPRTPSEAPLTTTIRANSGAVFYGATSTQDSLGCNTPLLEVEKTLIAHTDTDRTDSVTPGDVLSFRVVGTNKGDMLLTDVTIEDPLTGGEKHCDALDVGESCELLTEYVVTPADAARGSIENVAVGRSDQTTPSQSSVATAVSPAPQPAAPEDDDPQPEKPATTSETPSHPQKPATTGESERAAVITLAETGATAPVGWAILAAVLLLAGAALGTRQVRRGRASE